MQGSFSLSLSLLSIPYRENAASERLGRVSFFFYLREGDRRARGELAPGPHKDVGGDRERRWRECCCWCGGEERAVAGI